MRADIKHGGDALSSSKCYMTYLAYIFALGGVDMQYDCVLLLRERALDMYLKLHVFHPYVTNDEKRQLALAAFTGKTDKQASMSAWLDNTPGICLNCNRQTPLAAYCMTTT